MAYLMSDMAAGSNAALQLQQNMGAAPLAEQAGKAQAEKTIADTEKAKLSNLIAETDFKASEDSKNKLKTLATSPEFKAADEVKKLQMMSVVQFESGDIQNGSKTILASETLDAKKIATDQKQLDLQSQQIGNAYSVISAVPDDKVEEYAKMLPAQTLKPLVDAVGPQNWAKMSGTEKKEAAKNLMLNAKGQMAKQLKDIEVSKQEAINASRERIAIIRENGAMNRKMMGGDNHDMRDWNIYTKAQEAIEKSGKKTLEKLDANVDSASKSLDKAIFFKSDETAAYEKAVKARDDFMRKQIKDEINLAESAPKFPGKSAIIDNLKKEFELFPEPEEKTKNKAKPTSGAPTGATSNKYTEQNPAKPASKEEYEKLPPDSYYMQDGVLKRKKG